MKAKPNPIARILCPILILASVCMIFLPWISISAYGYRESMSFFDVYRQSFEYFTENGEALVTFLAGCLLILLGILGIVLSALGKKVGSILYFVFSLLVAVGAILFLSDQVGDYLRYLGLSTFSVIGIGAWLCAGLALVAMILMLALKGKPAVPARPMGYAPAGYVPMQQPRAAAPVSRAPAAAPAAGGWKCPKCATDLTANQKFCLNCGTKRPETAAAAAAPVSRAPAAAPAAGGWKCPKCGTDLTANQKFCLNCGTKRPETAAAAAAPVSRAPAAAPAAGGWKCPKCGTDLTANQKFCLNCGTKRPETTAAAAPVNRASAAAPAKPEAAAAPARQAAPVPVPRPAARPAPAPGPAQQPKPVAAGWRCPGCGAGLRAEQNFCPKCGTRRPEFKAQNVSTPAQADKPKAPAAQKAAAPAAEEPKAYEPAHAAPVKAVAPYEPAHAAPEPKADNLGVFRSSAAYPSVKPCPQCGAVVSRAIAICPNCGIDVFAPEAEHTPKH